MHQSHNSCQAKLAGMTCVQCVHIGKCKYCLYFYLVWLTTYIVKNVLVYFCLSFITNGI